MKTDFLKCSAVGLTAARDPKSESCALRMGRITFVSALVLLVPSFAAAQGVAVPGMNCKPVSQRTQEVGCWILADDPVGQLMSSPMFWHLDVYPTRAAAVAAKGPRATMVESLGKVWLMTIEDEKWRPLHGNRIAEIGPLVVLAGEKYSAQYMEAIFTPGMTAPAHVHSGPEAWYTLAGETCLETSDGRVRAAMLADVPMGESPIGGSAQLPP